MKARRGGGSSSLALPRLPSVWTLLTLLLWGVTFVMLPTKFNGFWTPKMMLWMVGTFVLVASQWWQAPIRERVRNPWMGLLVVYLVGRWAWQTILPQVCVPQTREITSVVPWVTSSLYPTLVVLGSLLATTVLVQQADDEARWLAVGEQVGYVAGALAGYGVLQWAWCDPLHFADRLYAGFITRNTMITTFGNPMLTADYLAIVAPLCLMFTAWRFRVIFLLIVLDLLLIRSTGALLAFGVSTAWVAWYQRSRWLWGLLGLLGVVGSCWISLHQQWTWWASDSGRVLIWQQALTLWRERAVLQGFGLGAVASAATNGYWTWASLHNELLQLLFETGLIGVMLVLGMLWTIGQRVWGAPRTIAWLGWTASALSFLCVSLVAFPLRIGATLMLGVCILAALITIGELGYGEVSA